MQRRMPLSTPCEVRSVLIRDAARLLGVSRRTVYYWIRDGRLRTIRTPGGSQRVLQASIVERLEEANAQRLPVNSVSSPVIP